jgi:hypothetical protein
MNDERFDQKLRAADPYRPEIIGGLDGAEEHLLEQIMSVPTMRVVETTPRKKRLLVPLAVAAAFLGLLGVLVTFRSQPASPRAVIPPAASAGQAPQMTRAAWQKFAEESPLLLIDQDGWKAVDAYGFGDKHGSLGFENSGLTLDMAWFDAKFYPEYRDDRSKQSRPEPVTVDGWKGFTIRYSDNDFATMLAPRNGVFVEVRVQGADRATYDEILRHVKQVDVRTWLAAMPPEMVTPDEVQEAAAKVLADVPQPPGFDVASLNGLGTNDAYQFNAQVIGAVGCGWIGEWKRAKKAGDDAAVTRAQDALKSSHKWKVLNEMKAEGHYPEAFWQHADPVAAGRTPGAYERALDC